MNFAAHNASDPKQVQRNEKNARARRRQQLADLRAVLKLPEGRRVFWALLDHCGVFRSIWNNSALIHFNEGKRDTGLFIMHEIADADPNGLITMMAEANAKELAERLEEEKAAAGKKKTEEPDGSDEE